MFVNKLITSIFLHYFLHNYIDIVAFTKSTPTNCRFVILMEIIQGEIKSKQILFIQMRAGGIQGII